ncbi:hypothetical protein Efla_006003 [Eimeria flavescens]
MSEITAISGARIPPAGDRPWSVRFLCVAALSSGTRGLGRRAARLQTPSSGGPVEREVAADGCTWVRNER